MTPITKADLDAVVKRINLITKSPETSYTKTSDGKFIANSGNYHLDGAYGGWALHRMCNKGGGVNDVFQVGHVSKREIYGLMQAFIRGIAAAEES